MRFLQQHAEVIVVTCVILSLGFCGALYWIFNYASSTEVGHPTEQVMTVSPATPESATTTIEGVAPAAAQ